MDGILFALLNTNALLAKLSQLNTLLFNVLSHIFGGNEATRQGIGSDGKKTAVYVDDQQRILIRQLARSWLWRSELPTAADCDGLRRLVCLRGGLADAGTVSGHAAVDLVYRPVYVLTA